MPFAFVPRAMLVARKKAKLPHSPISLAFITKVGSVSVSDVSANSIKAAIDRYEIARRADTLSEAAFLGHAGDQIIRYQ